MKGNFMKHKKKIIIGLLTIISYFFAPASISIPVVNALISDDTIELVHEVNVKEELKEGSSDKE